MSSRVKPCRVLSTPPVESLKVQLQMAEHRKRVGDRIAKAREAKGWSQRELADAIPGKVDSPSVSRWERGKVYPEQYLNEIAKALDVDVSYLLAPEPAAGTADLMGALGRSREGEESQLDRIEIMLLEVIERMDRHGITLSTPEEVGEGAASDRQRAEKRKPGRKGAPNKRRPPRAA